jgi:hypothetical protein
MKSLPVLTQVTNGLEIPEETEEENLKTVLTLLIYVSN